MPDSIKQMIEKQIDHLDAEQQRTLEAASVAGAEFSTLAVVAGLGEDRAAVEAQCDELARQRQFIQDCGVQELPNGEAVDAVWLHTRFVSERPVRAGVRIEARSTPPTNRRAGEKLYGERAGEIAAELAMHFERGRDYKRAAKYLQQAQTTPSAGLRIGRRSGSHGGGWSCSRGCRTLRNALEQELCLQLTLGVPLIATEGYAAPDVGNVYMRARELCQQLGDTPEVSEVLWGLWTFHTLRAELETAREIARNFCAWLSVCRTLGSRCEVTGRWRSPSCIWGSLLWPWNTLRKRSRSTIPSGIAMMLSSTRRTQGLRCRALPPGHFGFSANPIRLWTGFREALALARELSEPHGLAHALILCGDSSSASPGRADGARTRRSRHRCFQRTWAGDVSGDGDDYAGLGADRARADGRGD